MNIIHCLTIIIILKTYLNMGKQTDGSLSIEIKIKIIYIFNTDENYLYICTINEIKYPNMSTSLLFVFCFVFLLLKVIDFSAKAQSVDTFSSQML